jgi:hypothetical protein
MTIACLDAYVTDVTCQLHGWVQQHSMRRIVIVMDYDTTDCRPILDKHQAADACRQISISQSRCKCMQAQAVMSIYMCTGMLHLESRSADSAEGGFHSQGANTGPGRHRLAADTSAAQSAEPAAPGISITTKAGTWFIKLMFGWHI